MVEDTPMVLEEDERLPWIIPWYEYYGDEL